MNKSQNFECFLETKEGIVHAFYNTKDEKKDVLNSIAEFDAGDFWSVDACNKQILFDTYKTDPEENSFVLIPKKSIIKQWKEKKEIKIIKKSSFF